MSRGSVTHVTCVWELLSREAFNTPKHNNKNLYIYFFIIIVVVNFMLCFKAVRLSVSFSVNY